VTVLGPIRYAIGEFTDDRVAMLTFTGLGKGTARFSTIALVAGWTGCIVLDFSCTSGFVLSSSNPDDFDALLVVVAHSVLFISALLSPSSLVEISLESSFIAAGITAAPVLLHLQSHSLDFDLPPILITILLGAISLQFSGPQIITTPSIHRITYPIATLTSTIVTSSFSRISLLSLLPAPLLYYAIFTIPVSLPTPSIWSIFRHHPLLKKILHKDDSRKIFTFLCLNLGFMCVQMGYGVYTNSLGLVSDSIHMLVDCAAIAFGLAASVLADEDEDVGMVEVGHPYGHACGHIEHDHSYHDHAHEHKHHDHEHHDHHDHKHEHEHQGHEHVRKTTGKWAKLEDLAGFANGVFLVFVCLSILAEALGRLIWPEEVVEVEQLLVVSILGLAVNLVGVFSFNHGYQPPRNPNKPN
jgi:zinc transporter 5/7